MLFVVFVSKSVKIIVKFAPHPKDSAAYQLTAARWPFGGI